MYERYLEKMVVYKNTIIGVNLSPKFLLEP